MDGWMLFDEEMMMMMVMMIQMCHELLFPF